jgi:hypothetical protein
MCRIMQDLSENPGVRSAKLTHPGGGRRKCGEPMTLVVPRLALGRCGVGNGSFRCSWLAGICGWDESGDECASVRKEYELGRGESW